MNRDEIKEAYDKYDLTPQDVFKHQHYLIITRSGIEKIQALERIKIKYEVVKCEPDFCCIKAIVEKDGVETYGSAKHGDFKNGNTNSWYVMEMAEKRAMSRAVLKVTGLYKLGIFGDEESEEFTKDGKDVDEKPKPSTDNDGGSTYETFGEDESEEFTKDK